MREKALLGSDRDSSLQLNPLMYPWAWDMYLKALENTWHPQEIAVGQDVALWKGGALTDGERHLFLGILGMLTTFDLMRGDDSGELLARILQPPEITGYLKRLTFEEFLHSFSYQYVIENFGIDPEEIYTMYKRVPEMRARVDFANSFTDAVECMYLERQVKERDAGEPIKWELGEKQILLKAMIFWFCVFENTWFMMNLKGPIQNLARQGKFVGAAEQFNYIAIDECVSEGTEVLTPQGWLPVEKVTLQTDLAQWNRDKTLNWAKPINLSSHVAEDSIEFSLESRGFKQRVSRNHRFPYYTKDGNLKVVPAELATPNTYSKHPSTGTLRADIGTDAGLAWEERFLVALQADGTLPSDRYSGKHSGCVPVTLFFSKERKIEAFQEILNHLGWGYSQRKSPRSGNTRSGYIFRVKVPLTMPLTKDLKDWVFCEERSLAWCEDFIGEVARWDGHIVPENPNRVLYSCTNLENTETVQAIATLAGYRTKYSRVEDSRKESFSDIHRLFINRHQSSICGGDITKEVIPGKVRMYGIEVPSSFLLIRYGKCVSVTGNSLHVNFGTELINEFVSENPECLTDDFKTGVYDMCREAMKLEDEYIKYCLPNPILGYSSAAHSETARVLQNARLKTIGLDPIYDGVSHRFPWFSETTELKKEAAFFEKRSFEYKSGGALQFEDGQKSTGIDLWDSPLGEKQ